MKNIMLERSEWVYEVGLRKVCRYRLVNCNVCDIWVGFETDRFGSIGMDRVWWIGEVE